MDCHSLNQQFDELNYKFKSYWRLLRTGTKKVKLATAGKSRQLFYAVPHNV